MHNIRRVVRCAQKFKCVSFRLMPMMDWLRTLLHTHKHNEMPATVSVYSYRNITISFSTLFFLRVCVFASDHVHFYYTYVHAWRVWNEKKKKIQTKWILFLCIPCKNPVSSAFVIFLFFVTAAAAAAIVLRMNKKIKQIKCFGKTNIWFLASLFFPLKDAFTHTCHIHFD